MTIKRYLLFAGSNYYPSGGLDDLRDISDDFDLLVKEGKSYNWFNILDIEDASGWRDETTWGPHNIEFKQLSLKQFMDDEGRD